MNTKIILQYYWLNNVYTLSILLVFFQKWDFYLWNFVYSCLVFEIKLMDKLITFFYHEFQLIKYSAYIWKFILY